MSIKEALEEVGDLYYGRGFNAAHSIVKSPTDADIAAAEAVVLALYEQQGLELVRQKKLRLDAAKIAAEARTRLTLYKAWADDKLNKQKAIADELAEALIRGREILTRLHHGRMPDELYQWCWPEIDAALAAYNKAKEG